MASRRPVKKAAAGIIFNIQRFSVHDGPGIRTTIFLKGCPLHCLWCDNPEGQKAGPEIVFWKDRCIRCETCIRICPNNAIKTAGRKSKMILKDRCTLCGRCLDTCYSRALEQIGKYVTVDEVLEEIDRDRIFFEASGGGVTASGGEPIAQPEFVTELFKGCKEKRIHTAMETCGYAEWSILEKVLKYTDLVLYDIKDMDPVKHKKFVGVQNKLILENAKKVSSKLIPMVVRIPVILRYNDREDNIKATGRFISELCGVKKVNLLPYHRFGEAKYKRLGLKYRLKGLEPPREERLQSIKEKMESIGIEVKIGG